jgi:hypothetical protein
MRLLLPAMGWSSACAFLTLFSDDDNLSRDGFLIGENVGSFIADCRIALRSPSGSRARLMSCSPLQEILTATNHQMAPRVRIRFPLAASLRTITTIA